MRFARGSSAKNLIGSLIGAIDEDSRCGFLFSTLLEGKTFSHTFPINCSTKQRCQLYSTNIYQRKPANSKIFPRNSEPIRNTLPIVFFVFTLCRPVPDQENTLKHQPTHSFCICCRRAAWSTLEKYVLVKRLILPTSLLDTQTV